MKFFFSFCDRSTEHENRSPLVNGRQIETFKTLPTPQQTLYHKAKLLYARISQQNQTMFFM